MTAPPPSPARQPPPRATNHPPQPPPPNTATQQPPPQPHHYPVPFNYPPPSTHPTSQPPSLPPQPFVPHLTYMEGQFATQALLVEQQRRIKHLEAELASTQLEVMRLRSQVHHAHIPQPSPTSDPTAVSVHSLHPMMGVPHVPQGVRDSTAVSHGATVAAAAHAAAAAAALPRSTAMSQPQQTHPNPPPPRPATQSQTQQNAPQQQEEPKKASSRYWTPDEHKRFLEGLELFGQKDIKAISRHVGTRSATQVRTHAQKYYLRIERERAKAEAEGKAMQSRTSGSGERRVINGKHSPTGKSMSGGSGGGAKGGAVKGAGGSPGIGAGTANATRNVSNHGNRVTGGVKAENEADGVPTGEKTNDAGKKISRARQDEKANSGKSSDQGGTAERMSEGEKRSHDMIKAEANSVDSSHGRHSNSQRLSNASSENGIPTSTQGSVLAPQALASNPNPRVLSSLPMVSSPYASQHTSQQYGLAHTAPTLPMPAATSVQLAHGHLSQVKKELPSSNLARHAEKTQSHAKKELALPPPAPVNETPESGNEDNVNEATNHRSVKEEQDASGERENELGKRPAVPLAKKSPKKRMKKPSAMVPLPSGSASAAAIPSAGMTPVSLPPPTSSSGLNGPTIRPGDQKMYSLGEGGGSMSNLRALLRVPNEDQVAGPSGSKPPTLRRNGSSNSVLADLSKNVGVLSRSNSFVSPSGKGVTRSNSILSLLSGIPTALRESPSTERLLGLDGGEDRVMATLKSMDTGNAGPSTSGGGPSTGAPAPIGTMGDRSFSFGQLQHMGLDDLEDPSAVALALQEEQKWGDG